MTRRNLERRYNWWPRYLWRLGQREALEESNEESNIPKNALYVSQVLNSVLAERAKNVLYEIGRYGSHDPNNELSDLKDILTLIHLVEYGQYKKALKLASSLDTIIREDLPVK